MDSNRRAAPCSSCLHYAWLGIRQALSPIAPWLLQPLSVPTVGTHAHMILTLHSWSAEKGKKGGKGQEKEDVLEEQVGDWMLCTSEGVRITLVWSVSPAWGLRLVPESCTALLSSSPAFHPPTGALPGRAGLLCKAQFTCLFISFSHLPTGALPGRDGGGRPRHAAGRRRPGLCGRRGRLRRPRLHGRRVRKGGGRQWVGGRLGLAGCTAVCLGNQQF